MAGHSKWANIKHKKARTDAKRGKAFTKLVKEIMIAAKLGGSDIGGNPRLRTAIDKAKAESLPKDNIDRAIKKGAGELSGVTYEEGFYEGYGPGGVAILVGYMTDNKNRTVAEVRTVFNKRGGRMGESGSVAYMFDRKGYFTFDAGSNDEESLMEQALEAGADDFVPNEEDSIFEVYTDPTKFIAVKDFFDEKGLKYDVAELSMIPQNTIEVTGKEAKSLLGLLDEMEDLDDVQDVYANFDIPDSEIEDVA